MVAWNMYRIEINIHEKFVHQVDLFTKIVLYSFTQDLFQFYYTFLDVSDISLAWRSPFGLNMWQFFVTKFTCNKAFVFHWFCGLYTALYNTTGYPLQRSQLRCFTTYSTEPCSITQMCSVTYCSLKCLCFGGSKFMSDFLYQVWTTGNIIPHDLPQSFQSTLIFVLHTDKNLIMKFPVQQSRVVTSLLPGHNTPRRHLYLLWLLDSPLCRRRGMTEETSAHILCEYEALASLRHAYLGSFLLKPEDNKSLGLGAIWNFSKVTGLPWSNMGHKGPVITA